MPDGDKPVNDAIDSTKGLTKDEKEHLKDLHGEVEPNKVPSKTGGVC